MGKSKTKYPVDIAIQFLHPAFNDTFDEKIVVLSVNNTPLTFQNLKKLYIQFLEEFNIIKPAFMEFIFNGTREEITESFSIQIPRILDQCGGTLTIIVQSYISFILEQMREDIQNIYHEIQFIKERLIDLPSREEIQLLKKTSLPSLTHNQSNNTQNFQDQILDLDLGILFSEPIFDQIKKKPAANPVDFRSEIHRLHTALKSSIKTEINLKCQIATKQNLKHLIKFSSPKILHIICHGTNEGALEFQDDSRTVLGALQTVKTNEIIQTLRSYEKSLPQVVFVNSCYSQKVAFAFFQLGVNYVIAIESEDTIEDEAAQIFSEHFYRNIFSGQKVIEAFREAKERVKIKHNSFGCCCRHSSRERHKKNCRWIQMIKRSPNSEEIDEQQKIQKHKIFHVPSELCKCELKHLNRHKIQCEWARQVLFNINNDFRIPDGEGFRFPKFKNQFPSYLPKDQLVICCCFNYEGGQNTNEFRLPHSESNKFKIFENKKKAQKEVIFQIQSSAGRQIYKQLNDFTSPQLVETHEKIESSIMGRQREIFEFMRRIKDLNQNFYVVFGPVGVGRTSFVLKCVTYMIERRIYELYFYIDLYGIKDKDIFRYKFNQITKFNYDGQVRLNQVKNKMIIIILDNGDDFFELQKEQLYEELKNLRQELHKCKFILTLKEQNYSSFDFQRLHSEKFTLQPLSIQAAIKLIFLKMRHLFDITVQYNDIDSLVRANSSLRIPKFIESLCQALTSMKKKIRIGEIKKKLENASELQIGGNSLIEENIRSLKQKSQASYNLLLFMSQFSQGISINDFEMLSLYDKKNSRINLPIGKNWEKVFETLFQKKENDQIEKQTFQTDTNLTEDSDFSNPSLKNIHSIASYNDKKSEKSQEGAKSVKGQSYFLEEVTGKRFIVRRYIRDFIWKKHESKENYQMKHLFVGYMGVMLQIYFKQLVNSKNIHEDLLQYSSISESGLFAYKNNIINTSFSLTQSVRLAKQYNNEFERIIYEHPSVVDKIKKSDPSIFIENHKQDFLNIYEKRWDVIFQYLREKKAMEDKICLGYLQNLMLFIPTAFKIARVETSLLKYIISKSMSLLIRLQKYCEDQKYSQNQRILTIQLKLQLMKATIDLEKQELDQIKSELELNKEFNLKLMKSITNNKILENIKKNWAFEKNYILMYKEYISRKDLIAKNYAEKNKSTTDKIKTTVENFIIWINEEWNQAQQILMAKRNLILGLIYLKVMKFNSGVINIHANTLRLKKDHEKTILKLLGKSCQVFKDYDLVKLWLRTKLTEVQIFGGDIINPKKKNQKNLPQQSLTQDNEFYEELTQTLRKLQDCESIYTDRKNNLIGFMEFENQIKSLKKTLKQKLWAFCSNTLVCMRPVPLTTDGDDYILENLVRKKNRFRKQIEKVVDPEKDLCTKFQILTASKLKQEVQYGCTMLLLTTHVKIQKDRLFFVFEGLRMQEQLVQINKNFVQQYDLSKIKILLICGNNAFEAIQQLSNILQDPPILISLGNSTYDNFQKSNKKDTKQFKDYEYEELFVIEEKRKCQIEFLKEFVRKIMSKDIHSKEQILQICSQCKYLVKGTLLLNALSNKRKSPIQIIHKKGTYKDFSPGYQKNHNIDMKLKVSDTNTNFICLRRWKDIYKIFQYITKWSQQNQKYQGIEDQFKGEIKGQSRKQLQKTVYINVFGDCGCGKSSFVQQIARLFVERQKYSAGVYIIDGKVLEKKYQGQFQVFFTKESDSSRIISLEEFQQNGNENLMLIIDDFNVIKPRSNGRFNLFLQKIVEKKVNLIIVTNSQYQHDSSKGEKKDSSFLFQKLKQIKIQKLALMQVDLIAASILDFKNLDLLQRYKDLKKKNNSNIRVQDIYDLKSNYYGKRKQNELNVPDFKDMRKMQSLNQG